MSISIVLADDHPVVREGLRRVFAAATDLNLVGEAADGLETVRLVESLQPDVLVLDVQMPSLGGLDILSIVQQRSAKTRVVMFSMFAGNDFVLQAFRNGALAYVVKGCDPAHVITAIRKVVAGERFLGPALVDRAVAAYQDKAEASSPDPHDLLTPREREVIQLTAEGGTGPNIAARLNISARTVEMHRANAMRKLGLKTSADLIRYALRRGMIALQE